MPGVRVRGVRVIACYTMGLVAGRIVEDDDFVDAEDGEGAGDGAGEDGFEVVGLGTITGVRLRNGLQRGGEEVLDDDAAGDGDAQGPGSASRGLEEGGGLGGVEAIVGVLVHFSLLSGGCVSGN